MGQPTQRNYVREREVLKWYRRGYSMIEIGEMVDLSRQRVWKIITRAIKEKKL